MKDNAEFYKACNLQSNPFRSNAVFEEDPRLKIWAGQNHEKDLLQKFLGRSRAEQVGNTNLLLLYGAFGAGKSHAVLWGMQWLRSISKGGKSAAYYIPTLKRDKGKLTFAGAFRDDLIAKTALVDDVLQFRNFLTQCHSKYVAENNSGTGVTTDEVIERLLPAVDLYNFAKELYRFDKPDAVRDFLLNKSETDYQAMITFARVVNLFVYEIKFANDTKRFRQSVHLFIDELDVLQQASTKEVLDVNDLIRHLYDLCPYCFGLVLAVSAEQEILSSLFAEYVLTRVSRQIEFKPLDRDGAIEFAIHIMDADRADKTAKNKVASFPFTKDALEAILGQLSFRTPRKIVNVMQQLIEEARLADIDPSKGPISVEKLDQTGIMDEVL